MQQSRKRKLTRKDKRKRNTAFRALEKALGMKLPTPIFGIGRNLGMRALKNPKGPYPGAHATFRQLASTLTTSSGLSNVGGSAAVAQLIQNGATSVYFSIAFNLADFPQVSTFSALFDQYRIEKVLVRATARSNAVFIANTAAPNAAVPLGYLVVDYDDATAPSAITDLYQYGNCQRFNGEEDWVVELVPALTPAVYSSGAFSGYEVSPSNAHWIDVANTSVPTYGIKGGIGPLTATTTSSWVWDLEIEAILSFKNSR